MDTQQTTQPKPFSKETCEGATAPKLYLLTIAGAHRTDADEAGGDPAPEMIAVTDRWLATAGVRLDRATPVEASELRQQRRFHVYDRDAYGHQQLLMFSAATQTYVDSYRRGIIPDTLRTEIPAPLPERVRAVAAKAAEAVARKRAARARKPAAV